MRVEWAIPCRYVEVNNGLATMVGAGIDTYYPVEFPATLEALVAVRLRGADSDGQHSISMTILDPEFTEVYRLDSSFGMEPNPQMMAGWEGQMIIPTLHRFVAPVEGVYTLSITVDDSPAHTVPLVVRLPPT